MEKLGWFIQDIQRKTLHYLELTMPLRKYIDIRQKEKTCRYTPLITDIRGYQWSLNCFKVSRTGFVNTMNKVIVNTMQCSAVQCTTLHKFIKKEI